MVSSAIRWRREHPDRSGHHRLASGREFSAADAPRLRSGRRRAAGCRPDGGLIVQAAPVTLFHHLRTLQVVDRRSSGIAPACVSWRATTVAGRTDRHPRRHGAQAERASQSARLKAHRHCQMGAGLQQLRRRCRRRSWRHGSGPGSGECRWCTASCESQGPARPAPRKPGRCGSGPAWSRGESAPTPRPSAEKPPPAPTLRPGPGCR